MIEATVTRDSSSLEVQISETKLEQKKITFPMYFVKEIDERISDFLAFSMF